MNMFESADTPEPISPVPASGSAAVASAATGEPLLVPQVEVAPFAALQQNRSSSVGLAVVAFVLAIPATLFWLFALLYVAGWQTPLEFLAKSVSFAIGAVVVVGLPLVALGATLVVLYRTEPAEPGRGWAWLSFGLSLLSLAGIVLWLGVELAGS